MCVLPSLSHLLFFSRAITTILRRPLCLSKITHCWGILNGPGHRRGPRATVRGLSWIVGAVRVDNRHALCTLQCQSYCDERTRPVISFKALFSQRHVQKSLAHTQRSKNKKKHFKKPPSPLVVLVNGCIARREPALVC